MSREAETAHNIPLGAETATTANSGGARGGGAVWGRCIGTGDCGGQLRRCFVDTISG